ncbi:MAG: hypothetical protein HZB23_01680 [Deltaproteobacteria bacterium]|nr:hypothetical protein [Deltaproteobacteria bacterium]
MKKALLATALILAGMVFVSGQVFAGVIIGEVDPINAISGDTYTSDINTTVGAGGNSLDDGGTDIAVVGLVINNNYQDGWSLDVTSSNSGGLLRTGTVAALIGVDTGTYADRIQIQQMRIVQTGGTLGAGLTNPQVAGYQDMTGGAQSFHTGLPGLGTTATVDYAANLEIQWNADTSLLEGVYQNTITLTLSIP